MGHTRGVNHLGGGWNNCNDKNEEEGIDYVVI